jgi:hypothetical protein
MTKTFRHTGVLMMLGVLALGLVGAAYALWYEDLKLTANVTTGTFDVDWSLHNDAEAAAGYQGTEIVAVEPNLATFIPKGTQGGPVDAKYVQSCTATDSNEVDTTPNAANGNTDELVLNASGLYPYAGCKYTINIHNQGSVPAHFTFQYVGDNVNPNVTGSQDLADALDIDFGNCFLDPAGNNNSVPVTVELQQGTGVLLNTTPEVDVPVQLHTGDQLVCDLTITLEQAPVENQSVTIMATLRGHQWNEDATP